MSETAPTRPTGPPRRLVPVDERAPGWPEIDLTCTDTQYEVSGDPDGSGADVVVAMVTDCRGLIVGWDTCGRCVQHLSHCLCPTGVVPPRGVVLVHRARNRIAYPVGTRGGYIGFRHDASGQAAPMVFDSPEARIAAAIAASTAAAAAGSATAGEVPVGGN